MNRRDIKEIFEVHDVLKNSIQGLIDAMRHTACLRTDEHIVEDILYCVRHNELFVETSTTLWLSPSGNPIFLKHIGHLKFCEDVLGIEEHNFEGLWVKVSEKIVRRVALLDPTKRQQQFLIANGLMKGSEL